MVDKDIQREIEENQRRAREESDVGLEEDVIKDQERQEQGTILEDMIDTVFGDEDDSDDQDPEYDDTTKGPPSR